MANTKLILFQFVVLQCLHVGAAWSPSIQTQRFATSVKVARRRQEDFLQEDVHEDDWLQQTRETSEAEQPLRNFRYEDEIYDNGGIIRQRQSRDRRSLPELLVDFDDDDDDEDDDDNEFGEEPPVGNFWSNPNGGLDDDLTKPRISEQPNKRREIRRPTRPRRTTDQASAGTRRRRRSTFRTGMPEAPAPVSDFYNRLFWYGVDPDETTSAEDQTMFGGTKGKFNGLAYLNQEFPQPPPRKRRKEEYWEDVSDGIDGPRVERIRSPVTPPYDPPSLRRDDLRRDDEREWKTDDRKISRSNWASERVSKWFDDADDWMNDRSNDNVYEERRRRRRSRKPSSLSFLDAFLGVDRQQLESQAAQYDKAMDLSRSQKRGRRKNGQELYYNKDENQRDIEGQYCGEDIDSDTIDVVSVEDEEDRGEKGTKELSWEQRASLMERVPPNDVPAWGVSGEADVDARTKAISDALEEIAEKRKIVEDRIDKEMALREKLSVLRVDAELERKRLQRSKIEAAGIQEQLRSIEDRIADVARGLRFAQMKVQHAKTRLAEVETKHWGVLSFYNPDVAEAEVDRALRELEENEPAVRRYTCD